MIRVAIDGAADNWVQLKEIVEKEKISEKYLESIVSRLKNSGLLTVKRGALGGYKLAYPAASISLKQIVATIEGSDLAKDIEQAPEEMNTLIRQTALHAIKEVDDRFNLILSGMTLEDLVNTANNQMNTLNYMI